MKHLYEKDEVSSFPCLYGPERVTYMGLLSRLNEHTYL